MTEHAQTLIQAKNLILDPEHFAQDDYAYDADQHAVEPNDPRATCWCSIGAVLKVLDLPGETGMHPTFRLLEQAMGMPAPSFNDSHSHDEVLAAFDRAIELAKVNNVHETT